MNDQDRKPLVSIVVPSYNHESYVQQTIASIIDQDYENIELIVIDDGSTDSSPFKIAEMSDSCHERFVRFEFRSRENQGLCATLNEALEWCQGEFFSPIASDDMLLPNKTSREIEKFLQLDRNEVVAIFSGVRLIDKRGQTHLARKGKDRIYTFTDVFLRRAFIPAPTAMMLTQAVRSVGGYSSEITIEDLYMWLKLTEKGEALYCLSDVLVAYRSHSENSSKRLESIWIGVTSILSLYRKHPLYKAALASSILVHAHLLCESDKLTSMRWMLRAISILPSILISRSICTLVAKLIFPSQTLRRITNRE